MIVLGLLLLGGLAYAAFWGVTATAGGLHIAARIGLTILCFIIPLMGIVFVVMGLSKRNDARMMRKYQRDET